MSMVIDLTCGNIYHNGFRWSNKTWSSYYFKIENVELVEKIKNLVDDFYRTRKDRGAVASSYSYECKDCTIKRVIKKRKIIISGNIQIGSSRLISPAEK